MSRIAFTGNALGTGTVTMAAPNTNSDRTVTLPDQTGTLYISGGDIGTPSGGNGSNLTNLNASNLASGTVPDARFPATLPAASGANLTNLNASNLSSGTVPDARFPATLPAASGANLTSLNASNLSTGTVGTARLASGTANSTTYLRGDSTWQTISTTPPTTFGAVGTYAILMMAANTNLAIDGTIAGSSLRYNGSQSSNTLPSITPNNPFYASTTSYSNSYSGGGTSLSGTWRKVNTGATYGVFAGGCGTAYAWGNALYVRIS